MGNGAADAAHPAELERERQGRALAGQVMKFDIVTIFPRMVEAGLVEGVIGRGRTSGLLDIVVHDLRAFTSDRHRTVDDVPFGGGPGMVLKPEPLFDAVERITRRDGLYPGASSRSTRPGRSVLTKVARRAGVLFGIALLLVAVSRCVS